MKSSFRVHSSLLEDWGGDDIGEVWTELSIEVGKSGEWPDCFYCGRGFPGLDDFELLSIHFYFPLSDDYSQELHFGGVKDCFGEFHGKAMFSDSLEHLLSSLMVKGKVILGVNS